MLRENPGAFRSTFDRATRRSLSSSFIEPIRCSVIPILEHLSALPSGLTDLNRKPRSASNALDYSRAPLFDWPTGIALPPTGPGENDDLQDVVSRQLERSEGEWRRTVRVRLTLSRSCAEARHRRRVRNERRDARHPHEPGERAARARRGQRGVQRRRFDPPVPRSRHRTLLPIQDSVSADGRKW